MPAAGWYSAPDEPGLLRWWDGTAWSDHRHPIPPVAAPEPVAVAPAVADPVTADPIPPAPAPRVTFRWAWQTRSDGTLVGDTYDSASSASPLRRAMSGFIAGALLIVGSIAGFVYLANDLAVPKGDVTTQGIVTGMTRQTLPVTADGSGGGIACYPTATYVVAGVAYSAVSRVGTGDCSTEPNETTTVAYDPLQPANGMIVTPVGLIWPVFIFTIAGVFLLFLTIRVYRARMRQPNRDVLAVTPPRHDADVSPYPAGE